MRDSRSAGDELSARAERVASRRWDGSIDLRRVRRRSLALLCVVAGGLAIGSAPVLALSQRGHVLSLSFGDAGKGAGQFSEPAGIAVNDSTHEVFVADRGNNRVEQFKLNEKGEYEFASQFKVQSPSSIAVDNSTSPSAGDVYVVGGEEANFIDKYSPSEGKVILKLKGAAAGSGGPEEFSGIRGVAVDASGLLWVYDEEEGNVDSFTAATKNQFIARRELHVPEKFGCSARMGFAVSAKDEFFYVNREASNLAQECLEGEAPSIIAKLDSEGNTLISELDGENATGVAADLSTGHASSGDVYVGNVSSVGVFSAAGSLIQRLALPGTKAQSSGLAIDPTNGDVYVADSREDKVDVYALEQAGPPLIDGVSSQEVTASSARVTALLDPHGAKTEYFFQYGTASCVENQSACVEVPLPPASIGTSVEGAAENFGDQSVSVELQHLQPGTSYFYRVIASNTTKASGFVTVDGAETLLSVLPTAFGILPDHRAWEEVSPANKHGAGIEAPGTEGTRGAVFQASEDGTAITYTSSAPDEAEPKGNKSPQPIQDLSIRATSGEGKTEWSSQDLATTDYRAEGSDESFAPEYQFFSPDLSLGLLLPVNANETAPEEPPLSSENTTGERTIYRRNDGTCQATPATCYQPLVTAANASGAKFGGSVEIAGATPDLNHVVLETKNGVSLTESPPFASERRLYEWAAGRPGSEPLQLISVLPDGAPAPISPEPFLGELELGGTGGRNAARHAISNNGARVFWSEESQGSEGQPEQLPEHHLYVRDTSREETVQVDIAQGVPAPPPETEYVHFQTASPDGSRVFFTDTARLTEESAQKPTPGDEEGPTDLYECEVTVVEPHTGKLGCNLNDLTPDASGNQASAGVLGLALGTSEDGCDVGSAERCYVYFVANGVLAAGATPGHCGPAIPATETCNLYVYGPDREHPGQYTTKFIATLSNEDYPDWGGLGNEGAGMLDSQTARVSPSGRYLAFMSQRSLTGYDNHDANSGKPDQEVFLYDASTASTVCVSCNPTGARPSGVLDQQNAGEGAGLLVDRAAVWGATTGHESHWLAGSIPAWEGDVFAGSSEARALYQSRYLSDTGRLFFNSADTLVPHEVSSRLESIGGKVQKVGVENAYEYEPGGQGACRSDSGCVGLISSGTSEHESAFVDVSVSGNDAFFVTAAPLVTSDSDTNFDMYDARVCTESSPCVTPPAPPPPPCAGSDSCRSAPPPPRPPSLGPSGSATFSGPPNTSKPPPPPTGLTEAQKLTRALKTCRTKYKGKTKKRKRGACERQARKKYKATKAARHKGKK